MNASKTGSPERNSTNRPTKAEDNCGYVGREDAVGQVIERLTTRPGSGSKLVIQSIEGPGGIGKTALFEHVLQQVDRAALKCMTIKVSGKPGTQRAPRHFVWNPTLRIAGRRRARWACGQAAFEPVHMSTGRL